MSSIRPGDGADICHRAFSIVILSFVSVLYLVNVVAIYALIRQFIRYFKIDKKTKLRKDLAILCVITVLLFNFTSIGHGFMLLGVQNCNATENLDEGETTFSESGGFALGAIIVAITYIPSFIALFSIFSLKYVTISRGTLYPVTRRTQLILKGFRILQIICLVSGMLMFAIDASVALRLIASTIAIYIIGSSVLSSLFVLKLRKMTRFFGDRRDSSIAISRKPFGMPLHGHNIQPNSPTGTGAHTPNNPINTNNGKINHKIDETLTATRTHSISSPTGSSDHSPVAAPVETPVHAITPVAIEMKSKQTQKMAKIPKKLVLVGTHSSDNTLAVSQSHVHVMGSSETTPPQAPQLQTTATGTETLKTPPESPKSPSSMHVAGQSGSRNVSILAESVENLEFSERTRKQSTRTRKLSAVQTSMVNVMSQYTILVCLGLFTSILATVAFVVSFIVEGVYLQSVCFIFLMIDDTVNILCLSLQWPFARNLFLKTCKPCDNTLKRCFETMV